MGIRRTSYRSRLVILLAGSCVLIALFWSKRLSVLVTQWRQSGEVTAALADSRPLGSTVLALETRVLELDASLGDLRKPADQAWEEVLRTLATDPVGGARLCQVSTEIVSPVGSQAVHWLPVTATGSFTDLVRTVSRLGQVVPDVHSASLRFWMQRGSQGRDPTLQMTMYLQKIVQEHD